MSIDAINSLSEAVRVFNNPNTTKDEKREILAKYPDVVKYVGKDTTEYQISDEDFDIAKDQGKQRAKDSTGYDGHKSYRAVVDAVTDVGADVVANTVGKKVASKAASEIVKKGAQGAISKLVASTAAKAATKETTKQLAKGATKEAAKKAGEAAGKKVTEGVGESIGCIVGCVLGLAEGTKYTLSKPNADQVDAAKSLASGELPEGMDALAETQEIMDEAEEESTALAEEAELTNEEANEQIDEDKTKFDFYRAQYNALKSKAESGDKLSSDEKGLMNKLAPQMEQLGAGIGNIQEETSDTVADLNSDIEGYQDIYDESAETMADVEGVTDFAEGFDENTQVMCYVEGGVQTLNAAMSGKSSYEAFALASSGSWAFGATAWAYAFGVMGATGALMSTKGAYEQFKWAGEVGNEIDLREQTQDLNTETTDIYDEKLDTYAGQVDMVGDLELEVPDDLEVPVAPTTTDAAEGGDSANPFGVQPTDGQNNGNAGTRGAGKQKNDSANGKDNDDDKKKGLGVV